MKSILSLQRIKTYFRLDKLLIKAVDGVDLEVYPGEALGIVGESGCGKSALLLTILRLLPHNAHFSGKAIYDGIDLLGISEDKARKIIGKNFAFVPQSFGASLNPVMKIGFQIVERSLEHSNVKKDVKRDVTDLLRKLGVEEAEKTVQRFPHQLSGGMKQRALVAMGVFGEAKIVFLDEPTKGLDVVKKRLTMDLLRKAREETETTFFVISHDIEFIESVASRICVMYCGQIVEEAPKKDFFKKPLHPYSKALLESLPSRGMKAIKGEAPSMVNPPSGCRFHPRCELAEEVCIKSEPELLRIDNRFLRCHRGDGFE